MPFFGNGPVDQRWLIPLTCCLGPRTTSCAFAADLAGCLDGLLLLDRQSGFSADCGSCNPAQYACQDGVFEELC